MTKPEPEGVYRLTCDIPFRVWLEIRKRAEAAGVKPTAFVRAWLTEQALPEKPGKKP